MKRPGIGDKVTPDPQAGELDEIKAQLSAIMVEAGSSDPWTSRARPAFLYVIYALLLLCVPMGVLSAFKPDTAQAIAAGAKMWLEALPEGLYQLFAIGYLGYSGARSFDKWRSGRNG